MYSFLNKRSSHSLKFQRYIKGYVVKIPFALSPVTQLLAPEVSSNSFFVRYSSYIKVDFLSCTACLSLVFLLSSNSVLHCAGQLQCCGHSSNFACGGIKIEECHVTS